MLLALLVAVLAVALGAALTAVSGARPTVLGLLRTFAATAAAVVVLTHLLPDALSGAGLWGGVAFLAGLVGPILLHRLSERLVRRQSQLSPARLALEAGFIGLFVHHIGDGLGIGAYAALPGGVLAHLDVILALIAHTVPLVAVVTLAYRGEYGLAVALRRAGLLAFASVLGVVGSFAVPQTMLASAVAWIGALVSGVLLHVVTHDWLEDLPKSRRARLADLVAAALGLSLVLLGGHEPGHHHDADHHLLDVALAAAEQSAPFLLVALALTFVFAERIQQELQKLGKSLPVALFSRLGFAVGAEGLALGLSTYGLAWTLAAFLGATFVPLVAGLVAMLAIAIAGEDAAKATAERLAELPSRTTDRLGRFDRATTMWVVAAALAAVFQAALPEGALLGSIGGADELSLTTLLASLLGTGGPSVLAFGALTAKGLSPGAALIGVLLSSALGASTLVLLWRTLGVRGFVPVVIWLTCLTAALGVGINKVAPIARELVLPAPIGRVCAVIVLGLIVARAAQVGVRRWLAGWFVEPDAHAGHHHHHDHAHAHSSEMPKGSAATTLSPEASGPSAEA